MQEDEQLQKMILDQTKKSESSLAGSKPQSKAKEVAEPVHMDRRKGLPNKTIVSGKSSLIA